MSALIRLSRQTVQVLGVFLEAPREWRYGYDISRDIELKSGTLYPILMRLADQKLLDTKWEATEAGTPPRHMYRLTAEGVRFTRERLRTRVGQRVPKPVLGGT